MNNLSCISRGIRILNKAIWWAYKPVLKRYDETRLMESIHKQLISGLQLNREDVLLDAGCGYAEWLVKISGTISRGEGIDLLQGAVDGGKKRIKDSLGATSNISLRQWDLEKKLPFEDMSFTKITCTHVLSYVRNSGQLFSEFSRLLAPGGRLAIVVPVKDARFIKAGKAEIKERKKEGTYYSNLHRMPLAVYGLAIGKVVEMLDKADVYSFYSFEQLTNDIESAGLNILSMEKCYGDQAWIAIAEKPR